MVIIRVQSDLAEDRGMESPLQRGTQFTKPESCEEKEDLEEMLARRLMVRPAVKSSAVVSFHSNNKKLQMPFHSKEALKEMKSAQYEIHDVIRSSERRMLLSRACAALAMFGLVLTFAMSEVCRYGYCHFFNPLGRFPRNELPTSHFQPAGTVICPPRKKYWRECRTLML